MGNTSNSQEIVPEILTNIEVINLSEDPIQIYHHKTHEYTQVIKIVIISDTHTHHRNLTLPDGDILIHCGDFSNHPTSRHDYLDFNLWLGKQQFKHRLVVAGNHEVGMPTDPQAFKSLIPNAICLFDEAVNIEGITIYGSQGIPSRSFWYRAKYGAYNNPIEKWAAIPLNIDILITHTPPRYVLDYGKHKRGYWHEGDVVLLTRVLEIKPKIHCYGHNHDQPGVMKFCSGDTNSSIYFINAAMAKNIIPPVLIEYAI